MDDELFAAVTIRAARGRAEMSQRALALAAGVTPSVVCAYETGARQPSAKMLSRLMRAAGAQLAVVDPGYERQNARQDQQPSRQPRDPLGDEVRARKSDLESVVGMASALPHRAPGPLTVPPFRQLIRRS